MTPPLDLSALRALLDRATPGPFECETSGDRTIWGRSGTEVVVSFVESEEDAAAIVGLINAAGPLLRELEAARSVVKAARGGTLGELDDAIRDYDAATKGGGTAATPAPGKEP